MSAGNQRADSRLTRIDYPEPAGAGRAVLTPPFRLDGAPTSPGSAGDFARADGRVCETRDMEITIETPSHPFFLVFENEWGLASSPMDKDILICLQALEMDTLGTASSERCVREVD